MANTVKNLELSSWGKEDSVRHGGITVDGIRKVYSAPTNGAKLKRGLCLATWNPKDMALMTDECFDIENLPSAIQDTKKFISKIDEGNIFAGVSAYTALPTESGKRKEVVDLLKTLSIRIDEDDDMIGGSLCFIGVKGSTTIKTQTVKSSLGVGPITQKYEVRVGQQSAAIEIYHLQEYTLDLVAWGSEDQERKGGIKVNNEPQIESRFSTKASNKDIFNRGICISTWNSVQRKFYYRMFDTWDQEKDDVQLLKSFISNIGVDEIFIGVSADTPFSDSPAEAKGVVECLESIGVTLKQDEDMYRGSVIFIGIKGSKDKSLTTHTCKISRGKGPISKKYTVTMYQAVPNLNGKMEIRFTNISEHKAFPASGTADVHQAESMEIQSS